jgi:hypothetical protein
LSSAAPELAVHTEARLDPEKSYRADLLLERKGEYVVVEIKRRMLKQGYSNAVAQILTYLQVGQIKNGVLLFLPEKPSEIERHDESVSAPDTTLVVMTPASASGA